MLRIDSVVSSAPMLGSPAEWRLAMRALLTVSLLSGMSFAQGTASQSAPVQPTVPNRVESVPAPAPAPPANPNTITIPAGTKIPLSLKQAISTKNAREGDAVYAETAFPFVMNDRV